MDLINQYKGLPKSVYILSLARMISCFGMFIYPFLTLFLSNRIGLSEVEIGKFLLLTSLVYIPAAMIGGKLADRFTRKTIYVGSMFCANALFFSCGFFIDSINVVYIILVGFFFFNMAMPVISAMIMDLTMPENRKESMSLIYLGLNVGAAVGPIIAGVLFHKYTAWIFWGDALTGFVALAMVFFFIPDTTPTTEDILEIENDDARNLETAKTGSLFSIIIKMPILMVFALLCAFESFAYSQTTFMLPLHMEAVFGIEVGSKYFGYLFALNGAVVVVSTAILVLLTRKISPIMSVALAGLTYVIGFGILGYYNTYSTFLLSTTIWTLGEVLAAVNIGVYLANNAPITHRARFQSIFDIITGAGRALGPLLMGYYLIEHTLSQGWKMIGLLSIVATVGLILLSFKEKRKDR